MFDTMTMTKIIGGFCGAFLIFLLGGWAAETIYHGGAGGHGEDHAQGYKIEVADAGAEEAEPEPEVDFAVVFASADAAEGEGVWRNCRSCHALEEGKHGTGPSLFGIVGRDVDAVADYSYSGALELVADVWTPENLNGFLTDPKGYAPGTKMSFKGISKVEDRANLIAYLETFGG
ncbi:MAG: cytochrome c family protein [Yoonia sp.]|nr:cytochrome c family protein [Yoonia sp.]